MGVEVTKSMEMKKIQAPSTESSFSVQKVKEFATDIKSEIHKVHWTSREELIAYTKIVIISTFMFGMAIYFVDMTIQALLGSLSFLLQLITG